MINIGNDAIQAARELRDNEAWAVIRNAVLEQSRVMMNKALEPQAGADMIGYARAVRDFYTAFESATSGVPYNQVAKPGPVKK